MEGGHLSCGKRLLATLIAALIAVVIVVVVGELMVRLIRPQPSMYPRWQFSSEYGTMLFPDREMVHERPGQWRFIYTTNANQCRGELIPISNSYERQNVLVLGDSYSFGTGVNDDEVYAAVLSEELGDGYDTVNFSVGGWGLTQHIRRFYEFGRLYDPTAVIVQFCDNDPRDNYKNRVTTVENGKFVFRTSTFRLNFLKRFLSDSRIQKSQLYNLIRDPLYMRFARPTLTDAMRRAGEADPDSVPVEQRFYNELLELFARDLNERGISLIVISVDGQMSAFPFIEEMVGELDSEGLLIYCEVLDWFEGKSHPKSPEGHVWGREAHRIIGTELAAVIRELE
jgi:hypothetical protein